MLVSNDEKVWLEELVVCTYKGAFITVKGVSTTGRFKYAKPAPPSQEELNTMTLGEIVATGIKIWIDDAEWEAES